MYYNDEEITLYPSQNNKKKKNNYRTQKGNQSNKSYTCELIILSLVEFIIIIILIIKNLNSNSNSNNNTNNNNTNIINNKAEINITNSSYITDIDTTIPTTILNEEKINIGNLEYKKEIEYYKGKALIHIAMACDNGAVYSTLVSMASALENNNKENNTLVYHLLLSSDFNMNKISYFESLKKDYDFFLNYIKIPPFFKYIEKKWKGTETVQYKLLLSLLYPDISRMIFLDGDTLIFTDISEMYFLNFEDNYLLGYPYHTADSLDKKIPEMPLFQLYVNGGVLLFNIDKLRKDNMDLKLLLYHSENYKKTHYFEQDTLNYFLNGKIGTLPLKYGVYLFGNVQEYKSQYLFKMRVNISLTELEEAVENPSIVHLCCCNPKVWHKNTRQEKGFNHICEKYQKKFYFYANKTRYYDEIYNTYMK